MQAQPHLIGMYGGYELTPNLMICVASIAVFSSSYHRRMPDFALSLVVVVFHAAPQYV